MTKFIHKVSTTLVLFFFIQSINASERSAWYTSTNITTHQLDQNYPNPFYIETTIKYYIPRSGIVVLKIYNLSGQEIKTLVNGSKTAGEHSITWRPEGLPGGMYYYRLQAAEPSPMAGQGYSEAKKLILQK